MEFWMWNIKTHLGTDMSQLSWVGVEQDTERDGFSSSNQFALTLLHCIYEITCV